MNVKEAIMKRRTIRKFVQEKVSDDKLVELIDCARVAAYGANMQPLKFRIITDSDERAQIFPMTKWAGYLSDGTPKENERPTAYIAVLGDKEIKANASFEVEAGAAVTTMMLEAVEMGLSSCWLGAIERENIKNALKIPQNLDVVYLLALGYAAQESKVCEMSEGNVKYFLDDSNVINVPKRSLDEIIVK